MCGTHVLEKQTVQLLLAVLHAHPIPGVDDPHEGVRLLKVITPVRPERALSSDVPCGSGHQRDLSAQFADASYRYSTCIWAAVTG